MADIETCKCVIVIDPELPLGLIANTAAVLAVSLGRQAPDLVGGAVADASGTAHEGITRLPIPVLKARNGDLPELCGRARRAGLFVVDFTRAAQVSRHYDDYEARMAATPAGEQRYLGLALYGPAREVSRLTGSLGLLR
ncbi:DUF2000 domain-containing protein [Desulfocurvus sp. DL9XJH121]